MKADQLSALLTEHSLFSDCSEAELGDLILHGNLLKFKKGEDLIVQGDAGDSLLILLTGYCRINMIASNGHEVVLDYAEPGQVLGEIAMLDGGERTANVTAIQESSALSITRGAMTDIIAKHPAMSMRLLRNMASRIRMANTMIEADRAYTSGPRLARYLLRLSVSGGEGGKLKHNLSQSELGNFAGMSREHINRQLSAWSDDAIVAVESGKIRILRPDILSTIAEAAS